MNKNFIITKNAKNMKKLLSLLSMMLLCIVGATAQTTLIDYPTAKDGTAASGTTEEKTVKIHKNTDAVACYSLKNGYTKDGAYNENSINLTLEGGFKKGDVVTIAGAISIDMSNPDNEGKRATAVLFTINAEQKIKKLHTFADFINARESDADPVEESFTLAEDADALYLGRDGGTGAHVTLIKVVRNGGSAAAADATFDFQNNNGNWTVGEGANFTDGELPPTTINAVTLAGETGEAFYPAIVMVDNSGVISLNIYKNGAFKISAPEGKAVVKVEATMKSKTFSQMTASTGAITDNTWEGNATEVKFSASTLMSFLKVDVTLADKNSETVEPAVETFDLEAANIAEFNAAEDGKNVKLTLNNARVNGFNDLSSAYYVEDESGATVIKGITLTPATVLNGYIIGTKATDNNIDFVNEPAVAVEHYMTATADNTFETAATTLNGTVMTIAEASTQATYAKLVTVKNVSISGGNTKTLTDADGNTMKARDYMGVLSANFEWPEKADQITGVVIYYMNGWYIMPISDEAVVAAGAQPSQATFDFSDETLHTIGTAIGDQSGWIVNDTFTRDGVSLQVTGGSAPSRIYKNADKGTILSMFMEYATLTFNAPEGKAITKIEFTNINADTQFNLTPSSGAFTGKTWEGNAEGVRMLNNKSPQITTIVVTLADKTADTQALAPISYTELDNLADFSALENGTYAKLTLTDAEVTGISADGFSTAWIQDATGGAWVQYTSLNNQLKENTKFSGTIYAVKRKASGNPQIKETEDTPYSELTFADLSEPTALEGTISELNVPENLNKVVRISGVNIEFTTVNDKTQSGTITQGDATLTISNGISTSNQLLHKLGDVEAGQKYENVTVTGILVGTSNTDATKNQLLPIAITTGTSIHSLSSQSSMTNGQRSIYNLQGVSLDKMQKGINIVNGKKLVVRD